MSVWFNMQIEAKTETKNKVSVKTIIDIQLNEANLEYAYRTKDSLVSGAICNHKYEIDVCAEGAWILDFLKSLNDELSKVCKIHNITVDNLILY